MANAVYTVTRVLLNDDGSIEDFSTDICLGESEARGLCFKEFKIQTDQLIIGETLFRAGGCWYDDLYLAEDSGDDIDLHLRVDMHLLPD